MSVALRVVTTAVMITAGLEGCGPAEHPAPAEGSTATPEELQQRAEAEVEARRNADLCTPWSSRVCHIYYTDESGQLHCPASTEVCRPEGRGWFPCGEAPVDNDD